MNVPQLRIQTTNAQLDLNIQKPTQEIEQRPADLSIQQPKAELQIETIPGKLSIDQTKAREDMDLKSIARRIEEFAQNGYSDWLSGIARMAQQGDALMMIEHGGHPIADQAKENSESPMYDFNIGFVPSAGSVKIDYQPAKVNIDIKDNKPVIEVCVNKPKHNYTPGVVHGEMKQWPSINIEVIGLEIDEKK
ncbi:DUF6470 family protein [Fictibacillus iocasae]|uniref:DUF6470 family protein n=1 Tax=Fictibacillus iocasae TaxID=2715437 RepID=A0ABW2NYE6_9BACL